MHGLEIVRAIVSDRKLAYQWWRRALLLEGLVETFSRGIYMRVAFKGLEAYVKWGMEVMWPFPLCVMFEDSIAGGLSTAWYEYRIR